MEDKYMTTTELDDLGILGPTEDFGEIYYEDILEEEYYEGIF